MGFWNDHVLTDYSPAFADFLCVPEFRAERQIESHNTITVVLIFHIMKLIQVETLHLDNSLAKREATLVVIVAHHALRQNVGHAASGSSQIVRPGCR
jgi:hypothetical protein